MNLRHAAIFGGTFDPVHNGHLEAARRVQHLFALDQVMFVPACVPPHKRNAKITSAFHRFAMLALATEADATFKISTVELDNPDRPYAVDTVARLQAELGSNWRLFFIMGADSWSELKTWHDWQRLLSLCSPIVVTRPGHELIRDSVPEATRISDMRRRNVDEISKSIEDDEWPRTFFTDALMLDISATAIRELAQSGAPEKLNGMVPVSVAQYIEKHELYKNQQ